MDNESRSAASPPFGRYVVDKRCADWVQRANNDGRLALAIATELSRATLMIVQRRVLADDGTKRRQHAGCFGGGDLGLAVEYFPVTTR